jgi:hypothetical protein
LERLSYVISLKVWKTTENFFRSHSIGHHAYYGGYRNAKASDTRDAPHLPRIYSDAVEFQRCHLPILGICIKSYRIRALLARGKDLGPRGWLAVRLDVKLTSFLNPLLRFIPPGPLPARRTYRPEGRPHRAEGWKLKKTILIIVPAPLNA